MRSLPLEQAQIIRFTVANISAWGGDSEQLTFFQCWGTPTARVRGKLTDIAFSPLAVIPEPSSLALTSIGGILFALYRRFAPKLQ